MNIKQTTTAFLALSTAACSAAPLMQLGEDVQLHLTAGLAFIFEDNVLLTPDSLSQSDSATIFTPGLELRIMPEGTASATLSYKYNITRYADTTELNSEYNDLNLSGRFDSGVMLTSAYLRYVENNSKTWTFENLTDIRGVIVDRETLSFGASARYEISDLTAFKFGYDFSDVSYELNNYFDEESYSVPVSFIYKIRPKVEVNAGIRYRNSEAYRALTNETREYDDVYYFVGAVGEVFSPVWYADISVGLQERNEKNSNLDISSGTYNARLIYTGHPKTTAYISLARDFRTSAAGGSAYTFDSLGVGARYSLTNKIGFSGSVVFGQSDYEQSNREEDILLFNVGASYRANDYLSLGASYSYRDVDGNALQTDYSNSELRVTASLRY